MNNKSNKLIPELRFPEFANDGEWSERLLDTLGKTISGLSGKSGDDFREGKPFVTYKQVFDKAYVDFTQCGKVKISEFENQNELRLGDVLFTTSSETPNEVGFASVIINSPTEPTYLNSFCFIFRPENLNNLLPAFSRYLFHSPLYRKSISVLAQGSTRYNISKGSFLNLKLPLPSPAEQQKIASCLSSLEELITAHNDKLETLKTYKKGLMQNLFPQKGEKVPKLRFKEFEKDGEWAEKKLGELAELTSSKRVHLADYVSSGVPFFRGKEISQLKNNQLPNDILYISNEQYKEIKNKYGVPTKGDILITAVGTLGNVYRIKNDEEFYFKDGNLIWMKNILIDSNFLEVLLDVEKEKVLASAIGSSQKALTMAALNKIEFQIPRNPIEQQKVAETLSTLNKLSREQSNKIEQLKSHKKGLMQGLFPKVKN